MGETIEQGRCHLGITEVRGPFAEAKVGGDDDAGGLRIVLDRWNCSAASWALSGSYPLQSQGSSHGGQASFVNFPQVGKGADTSAPCAVAAGFQILSHQFL